MHETIRAGAFLRVEVWDWDRGTTDEPLGSFEVKVGEELLSQQVKIAMERRDKVSRPSIHRDGKQEPLG